MKSSRLCVGFLHRIGHSWLRGRNRLAHLGPTGVLSITVLRKSYLNQISVEKKITQKEITNDLRVIWLPGSTEFYFFSCLSLS